MTLRKYRYIPSILCGLWLLFGFSAAVLATTSDLEREKRWADQVVDALIAGEAAWLEARGVRFLGLYVSPESPRPSSPAIILIHGRGVHPAWGFIDSLRLDLADRGWHTLSLQMPVLRTDAKLGDYAKTFPEAFDRIDAGIAYLRARGIDRAILIGHSTGAMVAIAYAAERRAPTVSAMVAIGLSTDPAGASKYMVPAVSLEKISRPVLDIYGGEDLAEVLDYNTRRAAAAKKAGNSGYTQHREKGTNHFFSNRYEELRDRITTWLETLR